MRPEYIFVARHAADDAGILDENGRNRMKAMGTAIREIVKDSSIYLAYSTAKGARASAGILIQELGMNDVKTTLKTEEMEYLNTHNDTGLYDFIRDKILQPVYSLGSLFKKYADEYSAKKFDYDYKNLHDVLMRNVEQSGCDSLVVVTHMDITDMYPRYIINKVFNQPNKLARYVAITGGSLSRGRAIYINTKTRELKLAA